MRLSRSIVSGVIAGSVVLPGEALATPWALRLQAPTDPVVRDDRVPPAPAPEVLPVPPATAPVAPVGPVAPDPFESGSIEAPGYPPQPPRPPPVDDDPEPGGGSGLIAGGIVLTVVGAALIGGGAGVLATRPSAFDSETVGSGIDNGLARIGGIILIVVGVGPTVGGVVMTAIGAQRQSALREWQRRHLAPSVGRTRHGGWTLGVELKF